MFQRLAEALQEALDLNIITKGDFYPTDHEVWDILTKSGNKKIFHRVSDVEKIQKIKNLLILKSKRKHLISF